MLDPNDIITPKQLLDDERISTYMRHAMSADEETAFMADLHADADLRECAINAAYLAKAMKDVGSRTDDLVKQGFAASSEDDIKAIAQAFRRTYAIEACDYCYDMASHEVPAKAQRPRHRTTRILLAAACLLALLITGGVQYHSYLRTTGLGKEYAKAFAIEQPLYRGQEAPAASKELNALYANAQQGKDLGETIQRLSALWQQSTSGTYNDYTAEAPLIGWHLAIAHLRNNDARSAKQVLNKLVSITPAGSAVNQKAQELLKQLN